MAHALTVGAIGRAMADDFAIFFRDVFERLNRFLESVGLSAHREPAHCISYGGDWFGPSGLHRLRRIAAHLELHGDLPQDSDGEEDDAALLAYYRHANREQSLNDRLFWQPRPLRNFDHLMLHSDVDGIYLPQDFAQVLITPRELQIPGRLVGSSVRLRSECQRLADAIELPLALDPDSDEIADAIATPHQNRGWRKYAVEAYTCLRLHRAASHSVRHRAAVIFC